MPVIQKRHQALDHRESWERHWGRVATHTHFLRSRRVGFEEAKQCIMSWTRRNHIGAVGVGSPWEPESSAMYGRYEGEQRDRYYAGQVDPAEAMCTHAVHGLLHDLNHRNPATLHYLDNETPKCRNGHLWWFGWNYLHPAWHDYSQDRSVALWDGDPDGTDINPITGAPHRRRSYLNIVAEQRRLGALGIWAHPTSWWTQGDEFVTNIAAELPLHLHADGYLDGYAVIGYDSCHHSYQRLWWHLLDTGARVPGFAETDGCFDLGPGRDPREHHTAMPLGGQLTLPAIVAAARRGECIPTSGPLAIIRADGQAMGSAVETSPASTHAVQITVVPAPGERGVSRIDLIGRGGQVLWRHGPCAGGTFHLDVDIPDLPGWLVVRTFGEHDDPEQSSQKLIAHCALSNPVYFHAPGRRFSPTVTDYQIRTGSGSPWLGGTVSFAPAHGDAFEVIPLESTPIRRRLPASTRVLLTSADGKRTADSHVAYGSAVVVDLMRYLWQGHFRADFPQCQAGDVPPECFRIREMAEALQAISQVV